MEINALSPTPYAELPVEARALLFLYTIAAWARYSPQPPSRSEADPLIENVWNEGGYSRADVSAPERMTAILDTELASLRRFGGDR